MADGKELIIYDLIFTIWGNGTLRLYSVQGWHRYSMDMVYALNLKRERYKSDFYIPDYHMNLVSIFVHEAHRFKWDFFHPFLNDSWLDCIIRKKIKGDRPPMTQMQCYCCTTHQKIFICERLKKRDQILLCFSQNSRVHVF